MPDTVKCPGCQRLLRLPDEVVGQQVQCPKCRTTFIGGSKLLPVATAEPHEVPAAAAETGRREPDDDNDDRPSRARSGRRTYLAHRGGAILTIGILSLLTGPCGVALGPIAWIMGSSDLKEMHAGRMDPAGESSTNAGRICGIISTCLVLTVGCIFGMMFLFFLGERSFR